MISRLHLPNNTSERAPSGQTKWPLLHAYFGLATGRFVCPEGKRGRHLIFNIPAICSRTITIIHSVPEGTAFMKRCAPDYTKYLGYQQ